MLIGVLASKTDVPKDTWIEALNRVVPAKFLEVNIKAFEAGYNNN